MFAEYYGLSDAPFQLTPDHRFFFNSTVHTRANAYLTYGLSQGEGFIVVTGDVGAGKTTLVQHLLATLDKSRYVAAKIVTTNLDAEDMLRMVASVFGVPHDGADKAMLLERIQGFLAAEQAEGRRCVLVVDEAQNLNFAALEELRMLSNFQEGNQAQLQSFLLGQPQFRRTLASSDLDQFRQRIIASYHLGPLNEEETAEYIRHRLKAVGWKDDPRLDDDVFATVFQQSGGVPRRINALCSRLLLFGCLEERHHLSGEDVDQVAEDLENEVETILDDSPDPKAAEVLPQISLSGANRVDNSAAIGRLERRIDELEENLMRRDKAFRQALLTFSDYLQSLSSDLKKAGEQT